MSERNRRHLLGVGDLTRADAERILDTARGLERSLDRELKKLPTLRGRLVVNLFYESSTRTLSSFELAAKRLSADTMVLRAPGSSVDKGESLRDTALTLAAYDPDVIVIRHPHIGAPEPAERVLPVAPEIGRALRVVVVAEGQQHARRVVGFPRLDRLAGRPLGVASDPEVAHGEDPRAGAGRRCKEEGKRDRRCCGHSAHRSVVPCRALMRLSLVPRPAEFYELFTEAGTNALEAARKAETRFREFPNSSVTQADVKAREHEGDRITRDLIRLLNTQYVTPFDREDIFALATAIDDVVDHIEEATDLLELYGVESSTRQSIEQARILTAAVGHLCTALGGLKTQRGVQDELIKLKELEDEGDRVLRDAIADLFRDERIDPLTVIRWKDIFESLEEALDAAETAANVVGNIVVKNA